jgi:bacterioferritin-associated ferredoxin
VISRTEINEKVEWPGRESVFIHLVVSPDGEIIESQISGIGGPDFLICLIELRKQLTGKLKNLPVRDGATPSAIILREVLLRAKGEWNFPYLAEELCHCRAVPTAKVDLAVCMGAHSVRKVRECTSANTACGTCRPDVEAIIDYRLNQNTPPTKI